MSTKKTLSESQVKDVIMALKKHDFHQESETEFKEKTTYITVDESVGFAVTAYYDFNNDDARSSVSDSDIYYTVKVSGLEFAATQSNGEIEDWQLVSDEYDITDEDMAKIEKVLNHVVYVVDPSDCDMDFPQSLSAEWSIEEVEDEISSQLTYDEYIELDDDIYPLEGTVEEFIESYCAEFELDTPPTENEYKILNSEEVAKRLAEQIYD